MSNTISHPIHYRFLSKKIDRENACIYRKYCDDKVSISSDNGLVFVEPLYSLPDYAVAQRLVVADFFSRIKSNNPISIICNPWLQNIVSNSSDLIRKTRNDVTSQIHNLLDKLSIRSSNFVGTNNVSHWHTVSDITQQLATKHSLAFRWDVCYYNIYSGTVVPDHRVQHELRPGIRYHIRFFIDSKKNVIVATIDDPSLLFGCVALLVNPEDKRYKKFIGKNAIIPLINKNIPVLGHDSISTLWLWTRLLIPAHNREDFQSALELWLPYNIYAINQFGIFTAEAKEFQWKHRDEFSSNIVQFIDDISNIENKESIQISCPVDQLTGNSVLPLLHQNIYCSLMDRSLVDGSLVTNVDNFGNIYPLHSVIEKDEQRCISAHNDKQPLFPISLTEWSFLVPLVSSSSLAEQVLMDLALLWCITFPVTIESLITSLSIKHDGEFVGHAMLNYLSTKYASDEVETYKSFLDGLLDERSDQYVDFIENFTHFFDTSDGVVFTQYGYTIASSSVVWYNYDYEYVANSLLVSLMKESDSVTCFCYDNDNDRLKHILYLYTIIYNKPYHSLSLIIFPSIRTRKTLESLSSYPSEVLRFSLLCEAPLSEQDSVFQFSPDDIHYFLNKMQNSYRFLWWSLSEQFLLDTIISSYKNTPDDYTDYDIRMIFRLQYLREEVHYYRWKYLLNKSLSLLIDILRFDIAELGVWIAKKYASQHTVSIMRFATVVSLHLLYPVVPAFSLSLLKEIDFPFNISTISDFFSQSLFKKNYKCSLMMDVLHEWSKNLENIKNKKPSLFVQSNRDFSDYVIQHKEFVLSYFHQYNIEEIVIIYESENIPSESIIIDMVTMNVGIILSNIIITEEEILEPIVSLTVLQGQLAYKTQLLQTMKNTVIRLRNISWQQKTLSQLQSDIDLLVKEIENLWYEISKMKYF